jgi:hypothetical protein
VFLERQSLKSGLPENTWILLLSEDDKNWHRCLSAKEDKILFRIVKTQPLIDIF